MLTARQVAAWAGLYTKPWKHRAGSTGVGADGSGSAALCLPQTVPALTPRVTACMRSRLRVHTAAASPYSVALARLMTWQGGRAGAAQGLTRAWWIGGRARGPGAASPPLFASPGRAPPHLIDGGELEDDLHGPKNLVAGDGHVVLDVVKHCSAAGQRPGQPRAGVWSQLPSMQRGAGPLSSWPPPLACPRSIRWPSRLAPVGST